ncbi:MAG: sigma-54-dependent Fis family transcriptional regulator [Verrucomicrobiae bacterium]|nr:sigma-54-dependent Fis family transcriptional regulator [Verrucomicrobiae bacterium]MCB1085434.1 sigma-54-dependent Fis family transcriptional regulator [Verrucomicrobiae bacterium]MCB1089894.1 sigma-54-dependent Fis family transcriptional regulator [Verrucomicrobiae bacterium]
MSGQFQRLKVLIADDDETVRNLLEYHSQKRGFDPVLATCGEEFMELADDSFDVALLDLNMPRGSGFDCLKSLAAKLPDLPAVVLSSADEIQDAVSAMKAGALDYLTKPFDLDEVFHVLRQAIEVSRLRRENRELKESIGVSRPVNGLIGEGNTTRQLVSQIEKISAIDSTVLLKGESGVGKGLIARTIHYASARSAAPFVTVSCPALPRELLESELFGHEKGAFTGAHQRRVGKIEMAAGGTLFLDEIGDLPLDLQPKLLNVLQDREFQRVGGSQTIRTDIRVIAATNVDLEDQVKNREFREDLYYRLNVIPLEVPPLRQRIDDLKVLAAHFLDRVSRSRGLSKPVRLSDGALLAMQRYDWPGNIRQLENVLERASAFCDGQCIAESDLPAELRDNGESTEGDGSDKLNLANIPLRDLERAAVLQTLRAADGNKAEAARRLGVTEKSVYNKLKRFGFA